MGTPHICPPTHLSVFHPSLNCLRGGSLNTELAVVHEVVATGCGRVLVAELGQRCHLPRITGALLP